MGKRNWLFSCTSCPAYFWNWFEHMTPDELETFVNETTCPCCASDEWKLTDVTRFAGGAPSQGDLSLFRCNECRKEFYHDLAFDTADDLHTKASEMTCPDCESRDWKLTDGVAKQSYSPPKQV